jgi:hypothetical protein
LCFKILPEDEVDSIIVKTYQSNSNFTVLSDSIFTGASHTTSEPNRLVIDLNREDFYYDDYKFEVLSIGKTYSISGYDKKKSVCNSCLPYGHTTFDILDRYYVNGVEKHTDGHEIIIEK